MKMSFAILTLVLALTHMQAAEISQPHVRVSGTAVLEIKPDTLRWRLTVHNTGPAVAQVAEEHAALAEATVRFLREAGIAAADVQSTWMQLSENRVYRDNSWLREGYAASTTVSFTAKDVARYRELWLGLARLKAVQIDNVTWDSSQRIERQQEARLNALKAAKAKATTMATALGATIAEPLVIEEDMDIADSRRGMLQMNSIGSEGDAPGANSADIIAPGTIPIRIRVLVAFRLVSAG